MSNQYNPIKLNYFSSATERLESFCKLDPSSTDVKETFEFAADLLASCNKTRSADLEDTSKFVVLQSADGKQEKKVTIAELFFIVGVKLTQETLDKRKDPEQVKELGKFIDFLFMESCELFNEGLHKFYPDEFQPVNYDEETVEDVPSESESTKQE